MSPKIVAFFLVCLSVLAIVQSKGCGPPPGGPGGPPPGGPHGGPHGRGPPSETPACREYLEELRKYKRDNNLGGPNCEGQEDRDTCEWEANQEAASNITPASEECKGQAKVLFGL